MIFTQSYIKTATLYVPYHQIEEYKASGVRAWGAFGTILPITHKVTYVVDGQEYATDSVYYNASITPMDEPTAKEGYTFSGWSEIPETMPAHDVTIEGTFAANRYKVTYVVDGEEYAMDSVTYGERIPTKAYPTKEGYTFSGWSEIPETMPAHDLTITGSFEANGIDRITIDTRADVYNLQGIKVQEDVWVEDLSKTLPQGIYIVNGKKVVVK